LSKPDQDTKASARPSALLQNLAAIAAQASGAHKTDREARYNTSSGAASAGKRLTAWSCTCGWVGTAKELTVTAGGLGCPSCQSAEGLRSA
jgi:hypothetical protein